MVRTLDREETLEVKMLKKDPLAYHLLCQQQKFSSSSLKPFFSFVVWGGSQQNKSPNFLLLLLYKSNKKHLFLLADHFLVSLLVTLLYGNFLNNLNSE